MSRFVRSALIVATVAATAFVPMASAARERPDSGRPVATDVMSVMRLAGQIYNGGELARVGLTADQTVTVTSFPSRSMMDMSSRDDR